jgi:hypothetical protein
MESWLQQIGQSTAWHKLGLKKIRLAGVGKGVTFASFCALAAALLFETERSQAKHGWKQGCWTDMATKGKITSHWPH